MFCNINFTGEVFTCSKCDRQWTDKEYLEKHYCQSNKQYQCTDCNKSYKRQGNLTDHIRAVHLGQGHQCAQCGLQFSRAASLRRHITSVHEGEKKFNCPFCYYNTNYKEVLTSHVNHKHTNTKPHQCPHCEFSCVHSGNLSSHIYRQHTNKQYRCRYNGCKTKCDTQYELMLHIDTHPKREFVCQECPMSFGQKRTLARHTTTHTGEKNFQCEYCDKKFSAKTDLTCHILTHTGVKDYKCDSCGKAFARKDHLTNHIKRRLCSKN